MPNRINIFIAKVTYLFYITTTSNFQFFKTLHMFIVLSDESHIEKTFFSAFVNNKGADQTAHISTFVVHLLASRIYVLSKSEISSL